MTDTERIERLELVVVFLVDTVTRLGSAVPAEVNILRAEVGERRRSSDAS